MTTLKHMRLGACFLAILVIIALAENVAAGGGGGKGRGGGSGGKGQGGGKRKGGGSSGGGNGNGNGSGFILPEALEEPPRSVVLQVCAQNYANVSQVQTVPPISPELYGQFGRIDAVDGAVTTTADPNSTEIARVYGNLFYDNQDLTRSDVIILATVVFNNNSGLPPNSNINVQGLINDQSFVPSSNYSVTGGTGAFACARGVVEETLVFASATLTTFCEKLSIVVGCGFNNNTAFYLS